MMIVRQLAAVLVLFLVTGALVAVADKPAPAAAGKTYYVDFASGHDDAAGTAATAPWKHCPGDPAATANALAAVLSPGDRIVFKGGVAYRGSIVAQQSGAAGKPIVYDGNSENSFGVGEAILDGSEPLTGWQKCASAAQCEGNPHWADIWRTEAPFAVPDPFSANLYENEKLVIVAEDPSPKDPFFTDQATEYYSFDSRSATSSAIQDDQHLTQTSPTAWDGAYIAIYAEPNLVYCRSVTHFDPTAHIITFQELRGIHYYKPGAPGPGSRYAMLNDLCILNHPGQYVVVTENHKSVVYLWPLKGAKEPGSVSISHRQFGFNVNGQSYVTVQHFLIRKFATTPAITPHQYGIAVTDGLKKPNAGVDILNNIITDCTRGPICDWHCAAISLNGKGGSLIQGNQIFENRGCGGIFVNGSHHIVKDNLIRKNGEQGIWVTHDTTHSAVIGNTVEDIIGTHANGISVYGPGCDDIAIVGNRVLNGNTPLTISESTNITISCNVFQRATGNFALADWEGHNGGSTNVRLFHNVVIQGDPAANSIWAGSGFGKALKVDNIFVGHGVKLEHGATFTIDASHNLLTDLAHQDLIFVDPSHYDYRLKAGSPAIGAGTVTEVTQDATGAAWTNDKHPDIGAYVYKPATTTPLHP